MKSVRYMTLVFLKLTLQFALMAVAAILSELVRDF